MITMIAPELEFRIEGAEPVAFAAAPLLALKLAISCPGDQAIHSILLRCQVQIEATRRTYRPDEQQRMSDLFGPPADWDRTLRNLLWTHASVSVPGFVGRTLVDLHLPCSYDFHVAAVKYLDALGAGDIPLCVLFTGTIFYAANDRLLQVAQIPWDREATYRVPHSLWRETVQLHFPNSAWLSLPKETFDRLHEFKRLGGFVTFEQAVEALLASAGGQRAAVDDCYQPVIHG